MARSVPIAPEESFPGENTASGRLMAIISNIARILVFIAGTSRMCNIY
jgi:hypothetical protein